MPDGASGDTPKTSAPAESGRSAATEEVVLERLDRDECLRLISAGGVGRIAFSGRRGPTVLPVNYKLHEGMIVFRTTQDGLLGEDLRTGIAGAEFKVAFEIDDLDVQAREGWSVLIQGAAHHVDSEAEREQVMRSGVEPWPGGRREHFICIRPARIAGRRIRRPAHGSGAA